ncbi:MAG TPA: M28 family peptidase, partial [Terricaulis sp.]|nr:M28 family peptidase [Terricaulis sp.]
RFDSASAYATLTRINPENRAHPIGSAHNRLIRTRIETELRALGYAPEIQSDLICTDFAPGCSFVENIVAVKDGAGEDIILVTAHYDSAPIAPGAGDDLAGIAVMLEIARRIAETPTQNDIVFLFADGEEAGLRGAMAFARKHPLMERVELVLNMEARGVSGPSAMFETSAGAAPLIQAFAQSAPHPVANSLFYEVYRRMPNNTDLTIYKDAGAMAMNFAFSREVALYHSARDDNAHLSQASMAHHGENISAVLAALQDAPLENLRDAGEATYFDVFGQTLLHWPSALNLPLASVFLVLVLGLALVRKALSPRRLGWAGLAMMTLIIGHLALGWALSFPLGVWPGIHPLDHPYPWPARIALISLSVLLSLLIGVGFARRAGAEALLFTAWLLIALIGVALAALLPGGAYMALVPVGVFVIIAAGETALRRPPALAACVGLAAAAYMALYHFLNLDVVFNFQ